MPTYQKLKPGQTVKSPFVKGLPSVKNPPAIPALDRQHTRDYACGITTPKDKERFFKICKFIERNCSEFIAQAQASRKFLYRGETRDLGEYSMGHSRENRRPRDTDIKVQQVVDQLLSRQGFKALRGNSIFTISDIKQAYGYDLVYVIFPLNGFDYTWSHKFADWEIKEYELYGKNPILQQLTPLLKRMDNRVINAKQYASKWNSFALQLDILQDDLARQDYYGFNLSDIQVCLEKYKALVATNAKYNVVPAELLNKITILNKQLTSAKGLNMWSAQFCEAYKLDNNNLDQALKSGHEVYIRGQYVSIAVERVLGGTDLDSYLKAYFFRK